MSKITRTPTSDLMPVAPVQPMLVDPSRQSPQAAINAVNADSEKANMMNNMHGGWVPKSKMQKPKKRKMLLIKAVRGYGGAERIVGEGGD